MSSYYFKMVQEKKNKNLCVYGKEDRENMVLTNGAKVKN